MDWNFTLDILLITPPTLDFIRTSQFVLLLAWARGSSKARSEFEPSEGGLMGGESFGRYCTSTFVQDIEC